MINRRRRRCMWWTPWSTTPKFHDVGGSRQLQYGHHVTATVITKIKKKLLHHQREDFEPDNRSRRPLQRQGRLYPKPLHGLTSTRALSRTRTRSPLFMHIHLAERHQALRQREPPTHQGCAPRTCVCSRLLFLHPTQAHAQAVCNGTSGTNFCPFRCFRLSVFAIGPERSRENERIAQANG